MNKYNRAIINKTVRDYTPMMQPLLPSHPSHPGGRIAYAHMYDVMKSVFGCPIEQGRDCRLQDALDILKFCMDNATMMQISSQLYDKYPREPEPTKHMTLDDFFE